MWYIAALFSSVSKAVLKLQEASSLDMLSSAHDGRSASTQLPRTPLLSLWALAAYGRFRDLDVEYLGVDPLFG